MPFVVSWFSGINWDDQLLEKTSKKRFEELQDLGKIARCLKRSTTQVEADQHFDVFSDASEDADAAAMYERNVYED